MYIQLLNIALSVQWHNNPTYINCPQHISTWLLDESSLTKKLEKKCHHFAVEVRQQKNTNTDNSALSPNFPVPEKVLVREVFLKCDDNAAVFAQTEIPYQTLSDKQKGLADIGTNSLGNVLFKDKSLKRGEIEIAEFLVGSAVHRLCDALHQPCNHSLWARRSLFYIENKPLLVSEVFLPASGIYK